MRFLVKLIISATSILLAAYLLPGVEVSNFWGALIVALVLALINVTLKPLLVLLTLPITVFTLGLFLLVINAGVILIVDKLIDQFSVSSFWMALIFSIILSLINTVLSSLVTNDRRRPEGRY